MVENSGHKKTSPNQQELENHEIWHDRGAISALLIWLRVDFQYFLTSRPDITNKTRYSHYFGRIQTFIDVYNSKSKGRPNLCLSLTKPRSDETYAKSEHYDSVRDLLQGKTGDSAPNVLDALGVYLIHQRHSGRQTEFQPIVDGILRVCSIDESLIKQFEIEMSDQTWEINLAVQNAEALRSVSKYFFDSSTQSETQVLQTLLPRAAQKPSDNKVIDIDKEYFEVFRYSARKGIVLKSLIALLQPTESWPFVRFQNHAWVPEFDVQRFADGIVLDFGTPYFNFVGRVHDETPPNEFGPNPHQRAIALKTLVIGKRMYRGFFPGIVQTAHIESGTPLAARVALRRSPLAEKIRNELIQDGTDRSQVMNDRIIPLIKDRFGLIKDEALEEHFDDPNTAQVLRSIIKNEVKMKLRFPIDLYDYQSGDLKNQCASQNAMREELQKIMEDLKPVRFHGGSSHGKVFDPIDSKFYPYNQALTMPGTGS